MKNGKSFSLGAGKKMVGVLFAGLVLVVVVGSGLFAYLFDAAVPEENVTNVVTVSPDTKVSYVSHEPPITQPLSPQPHDETETRWWVDLRNNFESASERLREEYSHDLNISALVIDTKNNGVVMAYGDIDKRVPAYHIFWPITTAIFVDAPGMGISVHDEFPNEIYELSGGMEWRSAYTWYLLFDDIIYHEGYSTLKRGFRDGDPNVFFHAAARHNRDLLFEHFSKLGLGHVEIHDDISSIFGRFELSPVEVGLLYSMLINGGILYPALGPELQFIDGGRQVFSESAINQTMEVLSSHLAEMDEFWGIFGRIRDKEYFEEFIGSVIGQINDFMTFDGSHGDVAGSWFVGLYPVEAPRFVTVISLSYDLDYQRQRRNQGITRSSMTDLAVIMYEMFLVFRTQYQSASELFYTNEPIVTAADFGLETDFVWINNPLLVVCNERNISFHMQPVYFFTPDGRTEFSYLGIDVNNVETFPIYARINFTEAAKIIANAIYDRYGICVDGLIGSMHIDKNPLVGNAWLGWIICEELTRHSEYASELFQFRVDLVSGEVTQLIMNTPEAPFG